MKTTIKTVLVLLLSVMTFFSCSKDDDDDNVGSVRTELVGTWYSSYLRDGLTLYSDGTGFSDQEGALTWGATSSVISIIFEYDEDEELEKYSYKLIDNNTLRITLNDPETDEDIDVEFEREL